MNTARATAHPYKLIKLHEEVKRNECIVPEVQGHAITVPDLPMPWADSCEFHPTPEDYAATQVAVEKLLLLHDNEGIEFTEWW